MLNKQGIRDLASQLTANPELYDQYVFGELKECGTVGCIAGFCLLAEIGLEKYTARSIKYSEKFCRDCRRAGRIRLGIRSHCRLTIFDPANCWPADLDLAYNKALTGGDRVRVALFALQRLLPNGEINPDPRAIHTSLKRYLNKLSPKKKAA